MKKIQRKLSLNAETLRHLSGAEFSQVAAGVLTAACSGGTSSCCTDTCGTVCTKYNC